MGHNENKMAKSLPDLFAYLDYRQYLRDVYIALKKQQSSFSYRLFSKKAGMASPNFLKRVIDGERSLGAKSIEKFAVALALNGKETEFFRELVLFNQATTAADKNTHFNNLGKYRKHRKVRKLDRSMFEYLSHWYYPAIRELVSCEGFREDPVWISRHVFPSITPAQAKKAIKTLVKLGLLQRDDSGALCQGDPLFSTGSEVRSLAIRNFHKQMMQQAMQAQDEIALANREISGTTVALDEAGFKLFKQKIQTLRGELLELSASIKQPRRVIQFNFQAFPLASSEGDAL